MTTGARRPTADRFARALIRTDPDPGVHLGYDRECLHCAATPAEGTTSIEHGPDCEWAYAHRWLGMELPTGHAGGDR